MHYLQNGIQIQFKTIPTINTENSDFDHSDYTSIHIAALLTVHVFDSDRSSLWGSIVWMGALFEICILCANE